MYYTPFCVKSLNLELSRSRVVKYVKFSPKSTAYLVSEKSTRIFLKKYVNHHQ